MFQRIIYDEWTNTVPIISFCLTFGVFIVMSLRALHLKPEEAEQRAAIPLSDEQPLER